MDASRFRDGEARHARNAIAYALAQVLATVPITPGGLGVVEGSLTALLVAYGLPTNVALASVLLYRAVGRHQIGLVVNLEPKDPASDTAEDVAAAERSHLYMNRHFLDPVGTVLTPATNDGKIKKPTPPPSIAKDRLPPLAMHAPPRRPESAARKSIVGRHAHRAPTLPRSHRAEAGRKSAARRRR